MRKTFLYITILVGLILVITGCQVNQNTDDAQITIDKPISQTSTPTTTPTPVIAPTTAITIAATPSATNPVIETLTTPVATPATTEIPNEQPTSTLPPTSTPEVVGCLDEAAFYSDVTIPDDTHFEPGASMTKTWQIRNTGTCTWDEGYSLVFASGDIMDGPLSNPIPVVAPGDIADISINLVAPTRGGQQTGYWEFQNSHQNRFGVGSGGHDYIWVQIQVDWSSSGDDQSQTGEPTTTPGNTGNCATTENTNYENQVLSLINSARESAGLSALTLNSQLSAAALEHSRDMACADYVDHNGSDGSTWYDRVASQGYANYSSARENIYVGDPAFGGTPDGAFTWWMNSQVHRDNILFTSVEEIGIGYVYYADSSYGGYYTVVFARP